VEFSSLKFLKELQKTKIRNFKIKQILLLILRTLIIVSIVMAFARPAIPTALPFFQTYSKTSAVILLDNSFSLDVSDESGNRLKQAKLSAQSLINNLSDGDETAIIEMSSIENAAINAFSKNPEYLRERINKISVSNVPADLNRMLKIAGDMSDVAANLNKSLIIITDAQDNIFRVRNKDTANLLGKFNNVFFIIVGKDSKSDINNSSLDSLNIITSIYSKNKIVELETIVKNYSNAEVRDAVVSMMYDSVRVAQRSINIPAKENRSVPIAAPVQQYGPTSVTLELENDANEWDNKRFMGFNIPDKPKILINGSTESVRFINTALKSVSENEEFAKIDLNDNQRMATIPIESYDLIIISGIELTPNDISRLNDYISKGGNALLFPNNDANNTSDLLKVLGLGGTTLREFPRSAAQKFTNVDKNHPLFEGVFKLNDNDNKSIESPNIFKIMPAISGISLIGTAAGAFLTEQRIGDGKLLYLAVIPEMAWSNLPFTGIFPAIVYRSVIYLTSSQDISTFVNTGDPISINLNLKFQSDNFKIIDPNGNVSFISPIKLPGSISLNFPGFTMPGVYTIYDSKNKLAKQIAVNFDRSESELKIADSDKIKNFLNTVLGKDTSKNIIDNHVDLKSEFVRASMGTELWQLFLILAILFAIAEMIVQRTLKKESSL